MLRSVRIAITALFILLTAANCGGFSTEEAQQHCDQEQSAKSACFNAASYDQCVSCYEDCGDSCSAQQSCPERYLCAD